MSIQRMGLEVFLPKMEREKKVYGVAYRVMTPLFPGYLFARFCPSTYLHLIIYARGVHSIVSGGGAPLVVEDQIIEDIRSNIGKEGCGRLQGVGHLRPGDRVEVKKGPLRGITGIFDLQLSGRERVYILLDLIGYQGHISVEKRLLSPVAETV